MEWTEGLDDHKDHRCLKASGTRHVIRVPVIPGVNDSAGDRVAIAALVGDTPVERLPCNRAAGAKHPMLGRRWTHRLGW